MSNKWTSQQIRVARHVELKPLLESMGYRLQALTDGNREVHGLPKKIIIKQHYWTSPEDNTGGNAIDLLTHVIGMSFSKAMKRLQRFT